MKDSSPFPFATLGRRETQPASLRPTRVVDDDRGSFFLPPPPPPPDADADISTSIGKQQQSEEAEDASNSIDSNITLEQLFRERGDASFLVVDCGGGTVDITVHKHIAATGELKELHRAMGGAFGSTCTLFFLLLIQIIFN